MLIQIQNITWDFNPLRFYDDESLGLAYVGIPGGMLKRFINECKWNEARVPPHYDPYDEEDLKGYGTHSIHECYNTDTQIVLMNWLYNKRRKYTLEYRGSDPFWIFHDHQHSQYDVWGGVEVGGIYSCIEKERLLQGAEMAKDHGFFIQPKTAAEIVEAWTDRFKFRERDSMTMMTERDFYPLLQDNKAREEFSQLLEYGVRDY